MSRGPSDPTPASAELRPLHSDDLDGRLRDLARDLAPRIVARASEPGAPRDPLPLDPTALIRELRRFLSDS